MDRFGSTRLQKSCQPTSRTIYKPFDIKNEVGHNIETLVCCGSSKSENNGRTASAKFLTPGSNGLQHPSSIKICFASWGIPCFLWHVVANKVCGYETFHDLITSFYTAESSNRDLYQRSLQDMHRGIHLGLCSPTTSAPPFAFHRLRRLAIPPISQAADHQFYFVIAFQRTGLECALYRILSFLVVVRLTALWGGLYVQNKYRCLTFIAGKSSEFECTCIESLSKDITQPYYG